jgi:hypothetical protein
MDPSRKETTRSSNQDRTFSSSPELIRIVRGVRVAEIWTDETLFFETTGASYLVRAGAEHRLPALLRIQANHGLDPFVEEEPLENGGQRAVIY